MDRLSKPSSETRRSQRGHFLFTTGALSTTESRVGNCHKFRKKSVDFLALTPGPHLKELLATLNLSVDIRPQKDNY